MRSIVAAVAALLLFAACGVGAQDCSLIPGCTACQEVNVTGPGGHVGIAVERSGGPEGGRPPHDNGDGHPPHDNGFGHPPHNDSGVGHPHHNGSSGNHMHHNGNSGNHTHHNGSSGEHPHQNGSVNHTRLVCTACDTPAYKLQNKSGVCGCAHGYGGPAPTPGAAPPTTPPACTPCADGYVSGPLTKLGGGGRGLLAHGRRLLRHGLEPCVACPTNTTSNAKHTACVAP